MPSRGAKLALAALGIAVVGFAAVAIPIGLLQGSSSLSGESSVTTVSSVSTSSPEGSLATVSSSVTTSGFCQVTAEKYANLTWSRENCAEVCGGCGLFMPIDQYATLNSPQVLPFVESAYEEYFAYFHDAVGLTNRTFALLNVTGRQEVTGNWSAGYQIAYVNNYLLNVTVSHIGPSVDEVTHVSVYELPDRHYTIPGFTALQQKVIEGALANTTARSLMAGGQYYVTYVSPLENNDVVGPPQAKGNNTQVFPDTYFVQFNLVNGTAYVSAYVSTSFATVYTSYSDRPFSTYGGNGQTVSDPWWFCVENASEDTQDCGL